MHGGGGDSLLQSKKEKVTPAEIKEKVTPCIILAAVISTSI